MPSSPPTGRARYGLLGAFAVVFCLTPMACTGPGLDSSTHSAAARTAVAAPTSAIDESTSSAPAIQTAAGPGAGVTDDPAPATTLTGPEGTTTATVGAATGAAAAPASDSTALDPPVTPAITGVPTPDPTSDPPSTTANAAAGSSTTPGPTQVTSTTDLTDSPDSSAPVPASTTVAATPTADIPAAGLSSAPLTTAPLTTAPLTTAPLTTAPLTTAPLTTTPLASAPPTDSDSASASTRFGWGQPERDDEFTSGLDDAWALYNGPGHDGAGRRSPTAVTVDDGVMTINGNAAGTTDGMAWLPGRKYGRWEARIRTPAGDPSYHAVALLWPDAENWPVGGEVDFMEDSDPTRQNTDGFLHYGKDNSQVSSNVAVDATQWHDWAVEWTPDHMVAYVDGVEWFRTTDTAELPPGPMHLCLQLDWFPDGSNAVRPSTMSVDWVRQYPV